MVKLGLGMMRLPLLENDDFKSVDQEHVNQMVDLLIENGFNYFDTGYSYHEGLSEVIVRKAVVDRYPRDDFILADKLPLFTITEESQLEPIFHKQLEKCGVDYFDYYMLHNLSLRSRAAWIDVDSISFLKKKKEEGYIKHLGFSTHSQAEFLDNFLTEHPEMEFVLLQINYLDWENGGIEAGKCWDVARKHHIPIWVMEPLKGGFLANVSSKAEKLMKDYNPDSSAVTWAFRFVASLDDVEVVLTGSNSLEQLKSTIEIFKNIHPLNEDEYGILNQVSEIINSNIAVDCTKCRYCIDSCPQSIDISKLFDLYNNEKIQDLGSWTAVGNEYVNYSKLPGVGIASDCIECEACIDQCPQDIDIPQVLKDVVKTFEVSYYGF